MTVITGLRTSPGIVLTSDSQRSEGPFRESIQKLFATPDGIAWGTAGSIPVQQTLDGLLGELTVVPRSDSTNAVRRAITEAVASARSAVQSSFERQREVAEMVEGLFAWRGRDGFHLLRVPWQNPPTLATRFDAIGGGKSFALFAYSRSEHLGYETLPLDAAQMVAYSVIDDVIRASTAGVSGPVQVAVVTDEGARVLPDDQLDPIRDTVDAYRDYQREFIVRDEPPTSMDTGIRP